ncbi:MAG: type II toxin-antitoxin system VapC family toxin [Candidatus Melainabacteria bacterium]|nr:type II toxin-antitoxin system VapC family toxin [Candidatus Melainabacteria bacterium]
MSRYLLDANAVISLLNNRDSRIFRRVRKHRPGEIAVSSIVANELYYGAFRSRRAAENVSLIDKLQFEVLEFDIEDARQSGKIRAFLSSKGTPIGPYDVLIAGQAIARKLVLVTHNVGELKRVPELLVEDWE